MIDVRRLRDDPAAIARQLGRKGVAEHRVLEAVEAEAARRRAQLAVEDLRRRLRAGSRAVARATPERRADLLADMRELSRLVDEAEADAARADDASRTALIQLPNPPAADAPDGGADDYAVIRTVGDPVPPGPGQVGHVSLGASARLWDTAAGSKVSGSRFSYLLHNGAVLQQALVRRALAVIVERGFDLIVPPVLVREQAMYGTGFFPAERSEYYEVDGGELYLVGTSEVPLAGFHQSDRLGELPVRQGALSSCFRREAGAHGRDSAGIFRVHQFTKVEMFVCAHPSASPQEHERILAVQEELVGGLEIPYRVIDTAAGDLGPSAARKFDIEAWLPSEGRYREITSASNCTDFQARRLGIRFRTGDDHGLVHTLNGTAMTDRWLLFIAEHYQQPDGTVAVPDVLVPHLPAAPT